MVTQCSLSALQWSNYIRATVRKEKGLPILVELLRSDSDKVVRAVAIALRNLSIDRRNKDLIGTRRQQLSGLFIYSVAVADVGAVSASNWYFTLKQRHCIKCHPTGSYAMRDLVSNLPSGQQRPAKNLEEDTVVAILNTIHEIVTDSSENARSLIQAQAIEKLVAINRTRWDTISLIWWKLTMFVYQSKKQLRSDMRPLVAGGRTGFD